TQVFNPWGFAMNSTRVFCALCMPLFVTANAFASELSAEEEQLLMQSLAEDAASQAVPNQSAQQTVPAGGAAGALQSMNPDIALILDVAGAYFNGEPNQRGGHDPSKTGFNFQQLELSIRSVVDPFFR